MAAQTRPVLLSLSAMAIIGVLEYVALIHKIDSWGFGVAIAAIAGLGGYTLRHVVGLISPGKGD